MRGKKPDRPTVKVTIRVFADDVELAKQVYSTIGYNDLIRKLFSRHMNSVRELHAQSSSSKEAIL